MKIFLDTNIFLEYLELRKDFSWVSKIFDSIEDQKFDAYMSLGSFYTISYYVERGLKSLGIHRPELTEQVREGLKNILSLARVISISNEELEHALNNQDILDVEDAFQYQCALSQGCQIIITLNYKDFKNVSNNDIEIITPFDFVKKYLNV